jgi:adenosylmethionine-8-amino-7-oxononanoate aminotransferase
MNLTALDRKYIWHPFTPQKSMTDPIAIVSGKGSLLFDENGKSYIDAISSWWVTLHGHAHPYIAEQLYKQALTLEQVIFAGFTHEPAVTLAESLINLLPGEFSKIFFSDNGSTSTEVALKTAIQYWWNKEEKDRTTILAFENSYHGDTLGAMSVSDRSVFTAPFTNYLLNIEFIPTPDADNINSILERLKERQDIACFIYEPLIQGAGGMNMYDAELLDRILSFLKKDETICIADEVMTGFYRTGKLFASEYMNEKPDIICLSKGLTGGTMALGVTACTQKIYEAFVSDDKTKTFFHGHSFTANPLACTVANASLELLKNSNALQSIQQIVSFNERAKKELETFAVVKDCRTLGTVLAFELNIGKNEYLNSISQEVTNFALENGVYLRPLGNTVYWMPPYCITEVELNKVFMVVKNFIQTVQ